MSDQTGDHTVDHTVDHTGSDKKHVFIYGLARTGTTVLWESFRRDPRFVCFNEPTSDRLRACVFNRSNDAKGTLDEYLATPERRKLVNTYWSRIDINEHLLPSVMPHQIEYFKKLCEQGDHVVLKLMGCILKMGEIKSAFPEALHVLVMRDVRGFVSSHLKPYGRWLHESIADPDVFFTTAIQPFYWMYENLILGLGFDPGEPTVLNLMKVWATFMVAGYQFKPDLLIKHEDFCKNPVLTMSDVMGKLDLGIAQDVYDNVSRKPGMGAHQGDPRWAEYMLRAGIVIEGARP